jgi:tyrosine-protein phosphatase non-receptor type 4
MIEGVSRRTLAGSSGTYNVRATELAVDRGRLKSINATVIFLDDTQHCFKLDVSEIFIYLIYLLNLYLMKLIM